MAGVRQREIQDPIADKILRLQVSRDFREAALRHYRVATALVDAIWAMARACARIQHMLSTGWRRSS